MELKWLIRKSKISYNQLISSSPSQAKEYAEKMLGYKLITKQTGAAGRDCSKVYPMTDYIAAVYTGNDCRLLFDELLTLSL